MPDILTKLDSDEHFLRGDYGNRLRSWATLDDWLRRDGDQLGPYAVRTKMGGGGPCVYDLDPVGVLTTHERLVAQGIAPHYIMVNEMTPDQAIVVQGEYANWDRDAFHYSRVCAPMRVTLATSRELATGLSARRIIREAMSGSSYEDWLVLIDRYPDHVLEVSIYDRPVGNMPDRNAIVWEVRKY